MKRLSLFLIVCFLTFSCTENEVPVITDSLNPPGWIQGVWKTEVSEKGEQYGVQFTGDDLILLIHPEVSLKEEFNMSKRSGSQVSVNETITPVLYDIKFTYNSGLPQNKTFIKIDEETILWKKGVSEIEIKKQSQ